MDGLGGMMQGSLPIFDGNSFNDWRIKMQAIFAFQDVTVVVLEGLPELGSKATDEEKRNFKPQHKMDIKARFILYQCVGPKVFHRISKAETAKEIWEILIKTYRDGDKSKKVKMQTLRRQFECLTMEESETAAMYFNKIQEHVSAMGACRDPIID